MIVLAVILLVLILLAFLRFGVSAEYDSRGFFVKVHGGPFAFQVYPQKKKAPSKRTKKAPEEKEAPEKKGGNLAQLREMLPTLEKTLGKLKRKLTINKLVIYYRAAGMDPSKTAMQFGMASAGLGVLVPLLENHFKIRNRDFRSNVSFTETESTVYLYARCSLAVWEIIYIAWGLAVEIFVNTIRKTKNRKVDINDGQTSNRRPDGNDDAENQGDGGRQYDCRSADSDG